MGKPATSIRPELAAYQYVQQQYANAEGIRVFFQEHGGPEDKVFFNFAIQLERRLAEISEELRKDWPKVSQRWAKAVAKDKEAPCATG